MDSEILLNTQIITSILHTIGDCTADELSSIGSAVTTGNSHNKLSKLKVQKILDRGVQHGFVEKYGKMYTLIRSETDAGKRKKPMSKAKKLKKSQASERKLERKLERTSERTFQTPTDQGIRRYNPDIVYSTWFDRDDLSDTPKRPTPTPSAEFKKRRIAQKYQAPAITRRDEDRKLAHATAVAVPYKSIQDKLTEYYPRPLDLDVPDELIDEDDEE